jgi:hypothetical protein
MLARILHRGALDLVNECVLAATPLADFVEDRFAGRCFLRQEKWML